MQLAIAGTRGGPMRLRILTLLGARPVNTNQIAAALSIDYKTAEYHLRVLERSGLVASAGSKYADAFQLAPLLKQNRMALDRLIELGKPI
ncbi:MAG: winged helix-turn-helix transcriptional regulator [Candidatus Aenigmarchaeota archaeon]|nr:winged helix-turn-helix transcriptional regulator [Candidatus Aenigmarchaeota archaeon]